MPKPEAKNLISGVRVDKMSYCGEGMHPNAVIALYKAKDAAPAVVALAKMCCESDLGARTFTVVAEAEAKERAYWKASEKVDEPLYALSSSIRSIVGDQTLTPEARRSMVQTSIAEFAAAIDDTAPLAVLADDMVKAVAYLEAHATGTEIAKQSTDPPRLATLFLSKTAKPHGGTPMPQPTIEELEKSLSTANAALQGLEKILKATPDEKRHMADMTKEEAEAFMGKSSEDRAAEITKAREAAEKAALEKAASEETLTVDGATIQKSKVGPEMFAILKAQQARIDKSDADVIKARENAEMIALEKSASENYGHLPGTPTEKAALLKHLNTAPEAVRKHAEAVLKAAEEVFIKGFTSLGTGHTRSDDDNADAVQAFEKKKAEVAKDHPNLSKMQVLEKARDLYPDEFKKAQNATKSATKEAA